MKFPLILDATKESFRFLAQANDKSEWVCMFYFKFALGGFCASTVAMAIASVLFSQLINKKFELQNLYLPYRAT